MSQIKISVIIPVYNAQEYLEECIQSLVNQTLQECEFLFINDGSIDKSQEIIERFQENDKRIKLINQNNKGRSLARNAVLDIAVGTYIGFIDSDDYMEKDMLEVLYNEAIETKTDIVISGTFLGRDDKFITKKPVFPTNIIYEQDFIQKDIISNLLEREDLFAVWNKIYRKDLLQSHKIKFPNTYDEDQFFNILAFNNAKTVVFSDYCGYFYREVKFGVSKNILEVDYFKIAFSKLKYDYKREYNLSLFSSSEVEKLKSIRFIQKVYYLFFIYSISKLSIQKTIASLKEMVLHPEVNKVSIIYNKEILKNQGIYETLLSKVIRNKSIIGIYSLFFIVKLFYSPMFSETARFINKNFLLKTN